MIKNQTSSSSVQFQQLLLKIMKQYQKQEVNFYEFMFLLKQYNIKFYSKDQVPKITKLFEGTLNKIPIKIPFSHLQLISLQITYNQKYHIVKVLKSPKELIQFIQNKHLNHDPRVCLQHFKKVMFRIHGSQNNWFKVLGGLTIAVKISIDIFLKNLNKILRNTCHSQCASHILKLFILSTEKQIDWSVFMSVIRQKGVSLHTKNKYFDPKKKKINRIQSAIQKRSFTQQKNQKLSLDFRSTSTDFRSTQPVSISVDFKRCILHDRLSLGFSNKNDYNTRKGAESVDITSIMNKRKGSFYIKNNSRQKQNHRRCLTQSGFRRSYFQN